MANACGRRDAARPVRRPIRHMFCSVACAAPTSPPAAGVLSSASRQPRAQPPPLAALGAAPHARKGAAARAGARLALSCATAANAPALNLMSGICQSGQCSIKAVNIRDRCGRCWRRWTRGSCTASPSTRCSASDGRRALCAWGCHRAIDEAVGRTVRHKA